MNRGIKADLWKSMVKEKVDLVAEDGEENVNELMDDKKVDEPQVRPATRSKGKQQVVARSRWLQQLKKHLKLFMGALEHHTECLEINGEKTLEKLKHKHKTGITNNNALQRSSETVLPSMLLNRQI